ncbi:MAG: HPr family phosphocarrier protein [Halothiobacillaceae bacterium]|nr:HPr family phosphocarrier protein [Halothiobacillaceae bacterium]
MNTPHDKLETTVTIINKRGLHARAAARFATLSSGFQSQVLVRHGVLQANGKSIMSLMMLAAPLGSTLHIQARGEDGHAALAALKSLVDARFDEAD